jgi:hypothetical protein
LDGDGGGRRLPQADGAAWLVDWAGLRRKTEGADGKSDAEQPGTMVEWGHKCVEDAEGAMAVA